MDVSHVCTLDNVLVGTRKTPPAQVADNAHCKCQWGLIYNTKYYVKYTRVLYTQIHVYMHTVQYIMYIHTVTYNTICFHTVHSAVHWLFQDSWSIRLEHWSTCCPVAGLPFTGEQASIARDSWICHYWSTTPQWIWGVHSGFTYAWVQQPAPWTPPAVLEWLCATFMCRCTHHVWQSIPPATLFRNGWTLPVGTWQQRGTSEWNDFGR